MEFANTNKAYRKSGGSPTIAFAYSISGPMLPDRASIRKNDFYREKRKNVPQGLKPSSAQPCAARLKPCPSSGDVSFLNLKTPSLNSMPALSAASRPITSVLGSGLGGDSSPRQIQLIAKFIF